MLVTPSHVLLLLMVLAVLAPLMGRKRLGRNLGIAALFLLVVMGVLPTDLWLLRGIEQQYGRPRQMPAHVDGILTLGGDPQDLRLMGAFDLAKLYPQARVVFSGGSGQLIHNHPNVDARN